MRRYPSASYPGQPLEPTQQGQYGAVPTIPFMGPQGGTPPPSGFQPVGPSPTAQGQSIPFGGHTSHVGHPAPTSFSSGGPPSASNYGSTSFVPTESNLGSPFVSQASSQTSAFPSPPVSTGGGSYYGSGGLPSSTSSPLPQQGFPPSGGGPPYSVQPPQLGPPPSFGTQTVGAPPMFGGTPSTTPVGQPPSSHVTSTGHGATSFGVEDDGWGHPPIDSVHSSNPFSATAPHVQGEGQARRYPTQPDPEGGGFSEQSLSDTTQRFGSMNLGTGPQPTQGAVNSTLQPNVSGQVPRPLGQQSDWGESTLKPNSKSQCSELFLRMTINAVPNSAQLLTKASIPFGCVLHPLAESDEIKVPLVNFGRMGILRCRKCRGYLNPFVQFIEAGRRWRCNLCGLPNDVPTEYFCELDQMGRRLDQDEKPELSLGCVEFIAPSEYMVRRPMPPTYFFVIDVSYYSISSGMLKACVDTIRSTLDELPGGERTHVGFITFDSAVHFYHLKSSLSQPRMLVVADLEDVSPPIPDDLLVNLKESRPVVDALLDRLTAMHQNTQVVEVAAGSALKAAWEVMRQVGGKMLFFLSKLPSVGLGTLKAREDPKLLGTDKEVELLVPDKNFYEEFARDCSAQQICVDPFLFSPHYTDIATLGALARITGGQTYYYPSFSVQRDGDKFATDLRHNLTRETAWEAVMRIRTTKGVKVAAHYGNFAIRSTDLMALPAVDSDKGFGVQMQISETLTASRYVSVQNALLYTTSSGERRIRVATVCLPVTATQADLFRFADQSAVVALTAKMAVEKALKFKLPDARQALLNKCVDILAAYRASFSSGSTSTQLVLPETLKNLPVYTLALIKHIAFRSGADIRPDERSWYLSLLRYQPVSATISLLYPSLYALHTLPVEAGRTGPDGKIVLPPLLSLSTEKLDRNGIFLLDDGLYLLMWVARTASPELLSLLFSSASPDDPHLQLIQGNEIAERVRAIISTINAQHPPYQKLYIIREGDPMEFRFFSHFVEDKSKTLPSYYEFLVSLQRQIQARK